MADAIGPAWRWNLPLLRDTPLLLTVQGWQHGDHLILIVNQHLAEQLVPLTSDTPTTQRITVLNLARLLSSIASRVRQVCHIPATIRSGIGCRLLALLRLLCSLWTVGSRVVPVDLAQLVHMRMIGNSVLLLHLLFGRLYDETFAGVTWPVALSILLISL